MISLSSSVCRPCLSPAPTTRLRVSAVRTATMYEMLSVAETAGAEEIKAGYRRQARRWHPDACRSPGDERRYAERFMRAREAYEVLSDPARRRHYDLALTADRWAAAIGAAAALRADEAGGRARARRGGGLGDWEAQLEGLRRRSAAAEVGGEETWAGRVRRARAGPVRPSGL
ncbi:chaperone protein dnaJ [Musa troglodytarum]|uniref:Chaperone protein dnaJ n=1 Tax=Musa troglodytarum TaxID=320322 RepID=A0A9E7GDB1_9LILI|nr:chaperone protein dnaJ [Musa troglodytarum]